MSHKFISSVTRRSLKRLKQDVLLFSKVSDDTELSTGVRVVVNTARTIRAAVFDDDIRREYPYDSQYNAATKGMSQGGAIGLNTRWILVDRQQTGTLDDKNFIAINRRCYQITHFQEYEIDKSYLLQLEESTSIPPLVDYANTVSQSITLTQTYSLSEEGIQELVSQTLTISQAAADSTVQNNTGSQSLAITQTVTDSIQLPALSELSLDVLSLRSLDSLVPLNL